MHVLCLSGSVCLQEEHLRSNSPSEQSRGPLERPLSGMRRSKFSDEEINLIPEEQFQEQRPCKQVQGGHERTPTSCMLQRFEHEKHLRLEAINELSEEENTEEGRPRSQGAQQRANLSAKRSAQGGMLIPEDLSS